MMMMMMMMMVMVMAMVMTNMMAVKIIVTSISSKLGGILALSVLEMHLKYCLVLNHGKH